MKETSQNKPEGNPGGTQEENLSFQEIVQEILNNLEIDPGSRMIVINIAQLINDREGR